MNLIYTQPPTVMREHSSVLLARMIPQVNYSDEVGYQVALVGPVESLGYFTLNYQAASRTNEWYKEFPDTLNAILSSKWTSDSSLTLMPYESAVALPYNELYIEMELSCKLFWSTLSFTVCPIGARSVTEQLTLPPTATPCSTPV